MYIDSHAHWCDPRVEPEQISKLIDECHKHNIRFILQGGVDPKDWERQILLRRLYPQQIGLCFGLHPYFIAASKTDECHEAMDGLAQNIDRALALGETGLDFRSQYAKTDLDRGKQITFFEEQIELARGANKPLVLHIVRAHEEAQKVLSIWDLPAKPGFVHAFNSNTTNAMKYIDLGLLLSIGGAVTHPRNKEVREAVQNISLKNVLVESDSPDQAPDQWNGLNQSWSIWRVAEEISRLRTDVSAEEVLKISTENFKRLFSVPIL